jgi:hypothetical protein
MNSVNFKAVTRWGYERICCAIQLMIFFRKLADAEVSETT